LEQIVGVIQAGAEDWRRASCILSRAEDDDCVGRMNFLQAGFVHDADAGDPEKGRDRRRSQRHRPQRPGAEPPISWGFILVLGSSLREKTRKSPGPE